MKPPCKADLVAADRAIKSALTYARDLIREGRHDEAVECLTASGKSAAMLYGERVG